MNTTKKNNTLEIIFYCLFCILTIFLSSYHEPWFDELQAWAISKDSISNILFFLPHYEGHPPLWHLILKCFSYFNVPVEYGIKIPNLLFMFAAVWLLIFKSPFPKSVRLVLPFTYFIFYQYSIISRPYSIFCFALFLAAYLYKTKDEHPFKFMGALALLCLSSAYGMVFTAGICISWFIERIKKVSFKTAFIEKQFFAMFILFILCFVLTIIILPATNAYAVTEYVKSDYLTKFFSVFFIYPADATFTNILDCIVIDIFNVDFKHFFKHFVSHDINNFIFKFWIACFIGLVFNIFLFVFFKKIKLLSSFIVPYFLFLLSVFILYGQVHHIGLLFVFYIFSFWCAFSIKDILISSKLKKLLKLFVFSVIIVQIYWSICSYYADYNYSYFTAREMSEYIKREDLLKYRILGAWVTPTVLLNKNTNKMHISHIVGSDGIKMSSDEEFLKEYYPKNFNLFNQQHLSVSLNTYFNKNIFYNLNVENQDRMYLFLVAMTEEETNTTMKKIQEIKLPEVVIGQASLDLIFKEYGVLSKNYKVMETFRSSYIWKDKMTDIEFPIYMRNDLYYKWIKNKYEKSNKSTK